MTATNEITAKRTCADRATARLEAVVQRAGDLALRRRVLEVLASIESDSYLQQTMDGLQRSIATNTIYWEMCCALASFAETCAPRTYLEIGVRRGRSASIVAAFQPDVSLFLFDMWHPNYAGVPNPGPDFVRRQLESVGHRGTVEFIDGHSRQTIPAFFARRDPPTGLDLITVDGDHRDAGARADLDNVIPHLAIGGMIVFDDIAHPTYPSLHQTWQSFTDDNPDLVVRENRRDATGTALAVRSG